MKLAGLEKALSRLSQSDLLPVRAALNTETRIIGNELTVYPEDSGERYIDKGYLRNDAVYSIVSKNAEKCSQVNLYHLSIKREERKTAQEYLQLTKGPVNDKVIKEMGRMRKTMTDDKIIDSPLQKLLSKPNRQQTQSEWIEDIVGLRELQGEGNIWLNILEGQKRPIEIMNIPKNQLLLVSDGYDPWKIIAYEFILSGNTYRWNTDRVIMWKYSNPITRDAVSLAHLRGLAPLHAGIVLTQGMNEADIRVATSNKNGGASGLAYRTDLLKEPTVEQRVDMRSQFNSAVNSNEMANKIAILGGQWGYLNFAVSAKDQQLLEQYGVGFKRLCRIFKTPAGIFDEGNSTYDNQREWNRNWIYSKVSPIMYGLAGKLNDSLLPKFDLDPERHIIDCDISILPELATDLKEQVAALKDATWLSDNEKRAASGFDKLDSPMLNLTQREYEAVSLGGSLDEDVKLLNE